MASHSSIPAQRILWTEEPGGLQSMGSQKSQTRLRDSTTNTTTGGTNKSWESCVAGLGHNSGTTGKKGLQVKQAHLEGPEYAGKRERYWAKGQELEGVGEGVGWLWGRKASWEYAEDVFDIRVGKSSSRSLNFWWRVFQGGELGGCSSWWEARAEASRCGRRTEGQTWMRPKPHTPPAVGCLSQLQGKPNPRHCVDGESSRALVSAALSLLWLTGPLELEDLSHLWILPVLQEPNHLLCDSAVSYTVSSKGALKPWPSTHDSDFNWKQGLSRSNQIKLRWGQKGGLPFNVPGVFLGRDREETEVWQGWMAITRSQEKASKDSARIWVHGLWMTLWLRTSHLQNCGSINICCLSRPVVTLLRQPQERNTLGVLDHGVLTLD